MALMYNMIKNGQGENIFEFRTNQNGTRTRQATTSAQTHNSVCSDGHKVRVVEPWRQLPNSIKQAESKKAFKRALKQRKK
jgi:hypothetical protein